MENVTVSLQDNSTKCESIDDFRNQVYSTAYSLITVLGLVGNGFALVVLVRTYRQSSPFHVYMLNLAVSDLLCVMTLPLRVLYYVKKGDWNQGDFLCRISSYALYVNLYCSIYFMAAMSVTRFLAIVFPVQNLRLVTENRARLVCGAIWVVICLLSSPFLISGQKFDPVTNKTKCFEPPPPVRTLLSRTHAARRQRGTGTKAIRMIVIVLLTFLVSFMPYHVQRTVHLNSLSRANATHCETVSMQKSVVVTLCLAAANSCFDPLLYFFSGEGFRSRLSSLRHSVKSSTMRRTNRLKPITGSDSGENHQLKTG
ncbi:cysteinyl leukotriene receptor 1 isoform X2 [Archocentrus centrarchus]|uniref:cysteinyl leukotriene receptor 1 isoform X2 n=1 Tax=Archocentrus centrarchus TaxID=63155 RepID=UPI0011E9B68A|nr:cysteinyl leukotriene receptor 1 isoform X2 [Archocentrus centrarchus]